MKNIFKVLSQCFFAIFLVSAYAQKFDSIEDELKYQKNKEAIKAQMQKEEGDASNKKSQIIKDNSYIIVGCAPGYGGVWAFYKGTLYWSRINDVRDYENFDINKVAFQEGFDGSTKYIKKGNTLSWKGDFLGRWGESWEYHTDSTIMYRKMPGGDIKSNECSKRIENAKP